MQTFKYPPRNRWENLAVRPGSGNKAIEKTVRDILTQVKKRGDNALIEITEELDGIRLSSLKIDARAIGEAGNKISPALKKAIGKAYKNIYTFHTSQFSGKVKKTETAKGVLCWRKPVAVEKVGLYIPGGSAPLFSTVLMLGIPAQIAGCKEVILCSPPPVHPAILYAAGLCGIKNIFNIGGAQAIGAMAYGTATIAAADKIFGPGNAYVTAAKQLVNCEGTGIDIDMPAGPSEVLIIADDSSNPAFIAADLLSQAEHGTDSQVILLSDSTELINRTMLEVNIQLEYLPRKKLASEALKKSRALLFKSLNEAMAFSNLYAPEHLILCCKNAAEMAGKVINAGSVFIGNYSPESAGDYASGTNHTLPTSGFARTLSGISVESFIKYISFQKISRTGLEELAETIETMAEAEQLTGHKNAVTIRLKKKRKQL